MELAERRQERRIAWQGAVRLVIGGADPLDAMIADISEFGCGLQLGQPVPAGARVGIDGTGFEGAGVVRYCYPLAGGFRVGIELVPVG
jgi:hypothetical protein